MIGLGGANFLTFVPFRHAVRALFFHNIFARLLERPVPNRCRRANLSVAYSTRSVMIQGRSLPSISNSAISWALA